MTLTKTNTSRDVNVRPAQTSENRCIVTLIMSMYMVSHSYCSNPPPDIIFIFLSFLLLRQWSFFVIE